MIQNSRLAQIGELRRQVRAGPSFRENAGAAEIRDGVRLWLDTWIVPTVELFYDHFEREQKKNQRNARKRRGQA